MSFSSPLTLEIVKNELGISSGDTTYDAQITERIPFAEAKFRQVANYQFRYVLCLIYDNASDVIKVYQSPNSDVDFIDYGGIILSDDFPDGTYVIENYRTPQSYASTLEEGIVYELKVSEDSTAASSTSGSDAILSYNISHYSVLSQIVWYMISQQNTTTSTEKSIKSKSAGPLSVTYSDGDTNMYYGLPNKIVKQIPKYSGMY
jgi:hypothetical protein